MYDNPIGTETLKIPSLYLALFKRKPNAAPVFMDTGPMILKVAVNGKVSKWLFIYFSAGAEPSARPS